MKIEADTAASERAHYYPLGAVGPEMFYELPVLVLFIFLGLAEGDVAG